MCASGARATRTRKRMRAARATVVGIITQSNVEAMQSKMMTRVANEVFAESATSREHSAMTMPSTSDATHTSTHEPRGFHGNTCNRPRRERRGRRARRRGHERMRMRVQPRLRRYRLRLDHCVLLAAGSSRRAAHLYVARQPWQRVGQHHRELRTATPREPCQICSRGVRRMREQRTPVM